MNKPKFPLSKKLVEKKYALWYKIEKITQKTWAIWAALNLWNVDFDNEKQLEWIIYKTLKKYWLKFWLWESKAKQTGLDLYKKYFEKQKIQSVSLIKNSNYYKSFFLDEVIWMLNLIFNIIEQKVQIQVLDKMIDNAEAKWSNLEDISNLNTESKEEISNEFYQILAPHLQQILENYIIHNKEFDIKSLLKNKK